MPRRRNVLTVDVNINTEVHITWYTITGRIKGREIITYDPLKHDPPPIQYLPPPERKDE